jgi:hypothetical protein
MRSAATITEGARWLWVATAQFGEALAQVDRNRGLHQRKLQKCPARNHEAAHSDSDVDKEMAEASFTPF